jgi:hypothetical protein
LWDQSAAQEPFAYSDIASLPQNSESNPTPTVAQTPLHIHHLIAIPALEAAHQSPPHLPHGQDTSYTHLEASVWHFVPSNHTDAHFQEIHFPEGDQV